MLYMNLVISLVVQGVLGKRIYEEGYVLAAC
jgi:hypothetical protein